MDYHLTWYKCCPHWNDVHWPWPGSIPQRSRSHETFKGQSTHARVCSITFVCMDGLPSNLVQMLSSLRRCAVTMTRIHTSKWPMVVYNFGQIERKTKCSKKTTAGDIAVRPLNCLVIDKWKLQLVLIGIMYMRKSFWSIRGKD